MRQEKQRVGQKLKVRAVKLDHQNDKLSLTGTIIAFIVALLLFFALPTPVLAERDNINKTETDGEGNLDDEEDDDDGEGKDDKEVDGEEDLDLFLPEANDINDDKKLHDMVVSGEILDAEDSIKVGEDEGPKFVNIVLEKRKIEGEVEEKVRIQDQEIERSAEKLRMMDVELRKLTEAYMRENTENLQIDLRISELQGQLTSLERERQRQIMDKRETDSNPFSGHDFFYGSDPVVPADAKIQDVKDEIQRLQRMEKKHDARERQRQARREFDDAQDTHQKMIRDMRMEIEKAKLAGEQRLREIQESNAKITEALSQRAQQAALLSAEKRRLQEEQRVQMLIDQEEQLRAEALAAALAASKRRELAELARWQGQGQDAQQQTKVQRSAQPSNIPSEASKFKTSLQCKTDKRSQAKANYRAIQAMYSDIRKQSSAADIEKANQAQTNISQAGGSEVEAMVAGYNTLIEGNSTVNYTTLVNSGVQAYTQQRAEVMALQAGIDIVSAHVSEEIIQAADAQYTNTYQNKQSDLQALKLKYEYLSENAPGDIKKQANDAYKQTMQRYKASLHSGDNYRVNFGALGQLGTKGNFIEEKAFYDCR